VIGVRIKVLRIIRKKIRVTQAAPIQIVNLAMKYSNIFLNHSELASREILVLSLANAQSLISIGLITLFIFALRRRFKIN
jgi:hypothetical protein